MRVLCPEAAVNRKMAKDKEEKPKVLPSPGFANTEIIVEQLPDCTYVVWDRAERRIQTIGRRELYLNCLEPNARYVPLPKIPWPAIDLPPAIREKHESPPSSREGLLDAINPPKSTSSTVQNKENLQVFNDVKSYFIDHLDVANELFYDVYACYVLATWRLEDFRVLPYQFFLGPLASGKTRALECFHRLCYRSIMASSVSAAAIFRILEAWHPTLLLDEAEVYGRENMVEVLALLNSGYRRGQVAIRIEKLEGGCPQIAFFDTFGFKVLAGTDELAATLQSRCILTTMSKAVRHVNLFIDEQKAQDLRNDLLIYRFKNLGVVQPSDFDASTLNGFFNNSRVIELFVSLLQVAPSEEIRTRLISCMKQITQSRLGEEQTSIEARVFEAIMKCETIVDGGKISTQAITTAFNGGLSERDQATSRFIGRRVAALGFEKCRLSGGLSGFFWDKKLVDRLSTRYFPSPLKETSLTSQTSLTSLITEEKAETSPRTSGVSEESEVSEVILGASAKQVKVEELVDKTASLVRLTSRFEDKCVVCSYQGQMDWQLTQHDGSWGLLCGKCGDLLAQKIQHSGVS